MINVDAIKELIDQAPEIKTLFTTESYPVASMYDYNTGTHKTSSIDLQTIYKNPVFLQWKDRVCFELAKIEGDTYIDEIIALSSHFTGWDDKTRFDKLESKLYVLKDHLDEYKEDCSTAQIEDDSRIPEKEICDKMLRALSKLQRNHHYNADSSEDTMNDYIRDILGESYFMKDQTRQGDSENGDEAGEVDIQLCYDGLPVVMIEGIKVSSLERERLDSHMNKVLTKYDPNGCPYTFLIVYTTAKNFDLGYKNICNGVQREHNKKLNNGLPILHKVPPKRDYGRYFCIMAEKGGTSHGGLTEKLSLFFHAKKQEVNAYGR